MEIKEKIIEILSAHSEMENAYQYLQENDDLNRLDMNSISFIKMVVDMEREFGFEFEDEALNYNKFTSFSQLYKYVDDQMKLNNLTYCPVKNEFESIKKEIIKIFSQYIDSPLINQYSLNNLGDLNLSSDKTQKILSAIQEQFNIVLDNDTIAQEGLFVIDNLCNFIQKNV